VWYNWYLDAARPRPIRNPEDYRATDRLAVSCTQTILPAARERALVRQWCELLPTLTDVRWLWLTSRAPQELFDAACRVPHLQGLWIKWSGVRNIDAVRGAHSLESLHLGQSASVESIEPLAELPSLRLLGLEYCRRINDLTPIGALGRLEVLKLTGSIDRSWTVDSLEPLAHLTELRFLELAGTRAKAGTLRPLFGLRKLEVLRIGAEWERAELSEIRARNPGLAGD
jgi:hypothetical protein